MTTQNGSLSEGECKLLLEKIANIKATIDEIKIKLDSNYVTKDEFWPVRTIVYSAAGGAGLILLAYLVKNLLGIKP
jgi:tetrahydromethanopterin S-methyltransferase subunit B